MCGSNYTDQSSWDSWFLITECCRVLMSRTYEHIKLLFGTTRRLLPWYLNCPSITRLLYRSWVDSQSRYAVSPNEGPMVTTCSGTVGGWAKIQCDAGSFAVCLVQSRLVRVCLSMIASSHGSPVSWMRYWLVVVEVLGQGSARCGPRKSAREACHFAPEPDRATNHRPRIITQWGIADVCKLNLKRLLQDME
jgi:hypothetical protein